MIDIDARAFSLTQPRLRLASAERDRRVHFRGLRHLPMDPG